MADDLAQLGKQCKYDAYEQKHIPIVRAVDSDGNFVNFDYWLQAVWDGRYYGDCPFIHRLAPHERKRFSDVRKWQFYDDIMFALYNQWMGIKDE